ncbi:MAG: LOG family protein [Balneolia bacterium]|nr:LOG family protein [Balneolia bacterium]
MHHKPIGLLNTGGYYNPLLELTKTMTQSGFLKELYSEMLLHSDSTTGLLEKLRNYSPPSVGRVMTKSKV